MIAKIETLESKLNFPVARRSRKNGYIVVFSDECTGMVVDANVGHMFEVGYYDIDWSNCEDEEIWEPVELTVTG